MNRRGVDNRRKLRSSESSTENPLLWRLIGAAWQIRLNDALLWRHKQRDMTSSSTCDVVQLRDSAAKRAAWLDRGQQQRRSPARVGVVARDMTSSSTCDVVQLRGSAAGGAAWHYRDQRQRRSPARVGVATCDVVQQRHSMTTTLTPSETAADSSWIRTLGHHHPGLPVPPPADPQPGKGVRHHPGLPTAAASELVYPPDCGVATWASAGDTCCYLYDTTGISISDDQHLADSGQSALDAFSTLPLQVCCYRLLTCVFAFSDLNNQ